MQENADQNNSEYRHFLCSVDQGFYNGGNTFTVSIAPESRFIFSFDIISLHDHEKLQISKAKSKIKHVLNMG